MIYLDNSATTRPDPQVIETVRRAMDEYYGNPSSLHRRGVEAESVLKQARSVAAHALHARPSEIIFTSGGTESNNAAIKGVAFQYQSRGKHIITTEIEHPSVYDVCKQLEDFGFSITYLPVDKWGQVSLDDLKAAIRPDTILVSMMHVNNELGTIQPVKGVGQYLKQFPKILFHVDAVQSFGKLPLYPSEWGIDLLSISAHKIHGPRGVGILYKREGVQLHSLMMGGGQEAGHRSGTENLPGIAGLAKAIKLFEERGAYASAHFQALNSALRQGVAKVPGIVINTPEQGSVPYIMNLSIPGAKAEVLLHTLEEFGFLVSTKSACSSKANEPSRVLVATGMERNRALSSIRISLSHENTMEEIEQLLVALGRTVERVKPYLHV